MKKRVWVIVNSKLKTYSARTLLWSPLFHKIFLSFWVSMFERCTDFQCLKHISRPFLFPCYECVVLPDCLVSVRLLCSTSEYIHDEYESWMWWSFHCVWSFSQEKKLIAAINFTVPFCRHKAQKLGSCFFFFKSQKSWLVTWNFS